MPTTEVKPQAQRPPGRVGKGEGRRALEAFAVGEVLLAVVPDQAVVGLVAVAPYRSIDDPVPAAPGVAAWRRAGVPAWRRGGVAAWRRASVAAWRRGGVAVPRLAREADGQEGGTAGAG